LAAVSAVVAAVMTVRRVLLDRDQQVFDARYGPTGSVAAE
jgi:hypothetical protein